MNSLKTTKQTELKLKAIETYFHNLTLWLKGPTRNQFVFASDDKIVTYLRKGHHYVGDKIQDTLDIARIEIEDKWQRKGIGKAVVDGIHAANPFPITFIESILNPDFYTWLKREGWLDVKNSNPPCVYKAK